jgi:hypothetical protein
MVRFGPEADMISGTSQGRSHSLDEGLEGRGVAGMSGVAGMKRPVSQIYRANLVRLPRAEQKEAAYWARQLAHASIVVSV